MLGLIIMGILVVGLIAFVLIKLCYTVHTNEKKKWKDWEDKGGF